MSDIVARLRAPDCNGRVGIRDTEAADEIERLRAELAAAREALAFYAQHSTYVTSTVYMNGARAETAIEKDSGERARKALLNGGADE